MIPSQVISVRAIYYRLILRFRLRILEVTSEHDLENGDKADK